MADDTNNPISKVQHIADAMKRFALSIKSEHGEMLDAQKELQGKSKTLTNKRETLLSQIARLSDDEQWDDDDLKHAMDKAKALLVAENNDPSNADSIKAMQVFMSQIKLAAQERVRGRFEQIRDVITKAWEREQANLAEDKTNKVKPRPTPIKNFVSRKYELILRACREIHDPVEYGHKANDPNDRLRLNTIEDVVNWAIDNDPDKDPDKAENRLQSLAASLHELMVNFAHNDVRDAYMKISGIKSAALKQSREAMLKAKREADAAKAKANGEDTPTSEPEPQPEPQPEPVTPTPAPTGEPEGVFDANVTLNIKPAPTTPSQQLKSVIEALKAA